MHQLPPLQNRARYLHAMWLEPNMTLCLESYIGAYSDADTDDGSEGVKLEQQVLITETGYELLSRFPFEADLLGREV